MVNEAILGGLKAALNRGESLKRATMSFLNAGYKKEEVEEAARALQTEEQPLQISQTLMQQISQPVQQSQPIQQKKQPGFLPQTPKAVQRVSGYGQPTAKPQKEWLLFIMIILLLVLLGILAAVFFFKSELMEFFNKVFGT